jgi:hypothetical protein
MLYKEQKYSKKSTTTGYCRQCNLYIENEDHIIRCWIPSRHKIQNEWRHEFTTFLSESHTSIAIKDSLCYGFHNWLESGRNTPGIPPLPTRKADVMQAYNEQANIGWQNFIRGRMTITWGTLINRHVAKQKRYTFNAEHWGTKLMSIHWKYILRIWETRNKEVKGDTPAKVELIRRQNMIDEIKQIQETNTNIPLFARNLISRDIVSLRSMSTPSLSAYLYGTRMVVASIRDRGLDIDQKTLKQYFKIRKKKLKVSDQTATIENSAKT